MNIYKASNSLWIQIYECTHSILVTILMDLENMENGKEYLLLLKKKQLNYTKGWNQIEWS